MDYQASNILLCLHYGIGDLIMELPAIDRLRQSVPDATITAIGAEPAVEVLAGDRRLDRIVSIQGWGMEHLGDTPDEQSRRRFVDWLVGNCFDLILDPSHAAGFVNQSIHEHYTHIMDTTCARPDIELAQGADGLSALMRAIHQGWGLEVPESWYPSLPLASTEASWAGDFLETRGAGENVVAVSPGASHDLKQWPTGHFAKLCRHLTQELDAQVLLFCGPHETGILDELTEQAGDLSRLHLVRNLHLRKVAALLSRCRLYVGNDSGLMHLAAAVQTPVVIVFGPTAPRLYLPRGVRSRAIVSPVECPHRLHTTFGHPPCIHANRCLIGTPCIASVDPDEVIRAVEEEYSFQMQSLARS